jgi:hypothetical protein
MEGSQHLVYEWLQPIATYVAHNAKAKIIDMSGKTYSVMCNLLQVIWPTVTSGNTDNTK